MAVNKNYKWIDFLAILFILIGIFAATRIAVNLSVFDKYPTTGVLPINFMSMPYPVREQDCSYPVYGPDGFPIESETAKTQATCLEGVREARESAKINDISHSALFLFVGAGILYTRRRNFI